MLQKFTNSYLKIFSVALLLMVPVLVSAQLDNTKPADTNLADKFVGCDAAGGIKCIAKKVLNFLLALAFLVAITFLVIGGFRYIVSQGNDDAVGKAKGTILYAIIGIVVISLSYVILNFVFTVVNTGLPGT